MKTAVRSFVLLFPLFNSLLAANLIPANDPNIQYFGRWDFSTTTAPKHSWPGTYIYAEFEGTSIGISTNDNFSYYNVFIDDTLFSIFHGTSAGIASYILASDLPDGNHTILLTHRSETNWTSFSFNGFILDDGKNLLPPSARPEKKIEFIGDSYTVASGNEWTTNEAAPSELYTNIFKGFGPITARHYQAQYQMSAKGGAGLVLDYLGNYSNNIPDYFDRALLYTGSPKWSFSQWVPNLVVICLGLNDYNGWGGYSGPISEENAALYKKRYRDFIGTIMDVYPGANILAVAPNDLTWLKNNISQVVAEENAVGHTNVHYTYFPFYSGEFVHNWHPNLSAHQKIANVLIGAIDTIDAWTPYHDNVPPVITKFPAASFLVTDNMYRLNVETDTYAQLRYSTQDKPFDQMESGFGITGTREHSTLLQCEQNQQYTYYLRAKDVYGNTSDTSAIVQFSVDTTKVLLSWKSTQYNTSDWGKGTAPLGNDGATGIITTISPARTVYFRQIFTLSNVNAITDMRIFVVGHDAAAAYINGVEIDRLNLELKTDLFYSTPALKPMEMQTKLVFGVDALKAIRNGENILAVEIHSSDSTSNISFDAKIYDLYSYTYSPLGSEWNYYDKGNAPLDQLTDKTVNDVGESAAVIPVATKLYSNYPNPFNPATSFSFDLWEKSFVSLKIFDVVGREIATVISEELPAGNHVKQWNANGITSGVYFYRLQAGLFLETKRLLLLK